jgi:hypothetical protein
MNAKVYWVGLGGGLMVSAALFYLLYIYLPGLFVSGWYASDTHLA